MMKQIRLKQTLQRCTDWLKRPVVRRGALIGTGVLVVGAVAAVCVLVFVPQEIRLSFQQETCATSKFYLWGESAEQSQGMTLRLDDVAGAGSRVCIQPDEAPAAGEYTLSAPVFGLSFVRHPVRVVVPDLPSASLAASAKVPLSKPLSVGLSQADDLHEYAVVLGERAGTCAPEDATLLCDIAPLELAQGQSYDIALQRSFKQDEPTVVLEQTIEVLESVQLTDSSIAQDALVHDKPTEITLSFSKELARHEFALSAKKGDETTDISVETTVNEGAYVLQFDELPREATIEVIAKDVEATDGSTVDVPGVLAFRTSGGPSVSSIGIGTHDVAIGAQFTLQFDQELDAGQDITKFVLVEGVGASIRQAGSQVHVTLAAQTPRCTGFSVSVKEGLKSVHGVSQQANWKHQSRTRCYETRVIGSSLQGRPIVAYFFGGGAETVLYTGAIHGNELSSKYTMDAWIGELSQRAHEIPAGRQVVVVPAMSPDGVARATRYNARGINLNRNFPTANWVSNIPVSGGRTEEGAGGTHAGSEPETQALINLTRQLRPRFVVTFHSTGSLVNSNDVGMSISVGQQYARMTGYRFIANAQTNTVFGLEMTGTYEDWLLEIGIPAILIELPTHTGNFIGTNRNVLWMTLRS